MSGLSDWVVCNSRRRSRDLRGLPHRRFRPERVSDTCTWHGLDPRPPDGPFPRPRPEPPEDGRSYHPSKVSTQEGGDVSGTHSLSTTPDPDSDVRPQPPSDRVRDRHYSSGVVRHVVLVSPLFHIRDSDLKKCPKLKTSSVYRQRYSPRESTMGNLRHRSLTRHSSLGPKTRTPQTPTRSNENNHTHSLIHLS